MPVSDLCNRNVVTIRKDASVWQAADLMRTLHVGDVVVVEEHDGQRLPVGIVTDRDIVVEILAEEVDPKSVTVADFMSYEIVTVNEEDDVLDTIKLMRSEGIRRVPVVDSGGALVGILAVDDLIDFVAEMLAGVGSLIRRERSREEDVRP